MFTLDPYNNDGYYDVDPRITPRVTSRIIPQQMPTLSLQDVPRPGCDCTNCMRLMKMLHRDDPGARNTLSVAVDPPVHPSSYRDVNTKTQLGSQQPSKPEPQKQPAKSLSLNDFWSLSSEISHENLILFILIIFIIVLYIAYQQYDIRQQLQAVITRVG